MAVSVLQSGALDLYVRTPVFRKGMDKAWHILLKKGGPVDYYGERLIASATKPAQFLSAWASSANILTYGSEEAPAFLIGAGYVGGNHAIPGTATPSIFGQTVALHLDSRAIKPNVWASGNLLSIVETYNVRDRLNGPAVLKVQISRSFTSVPTLAFIMRITCLIPTALGWFSGLQSQKPNVKVGQTLWLKIPGAVGAYGAGGVDVTRQVLDFKLTSDLWLNPLAPPMRFGRTVKQAGAPLFTVLQGFASGQYRGDMKVAYWLTPSKKSNPRGIEFDPMKMLKVGESYQVSGYYGCVNGLA